MKEFPLFISRRLENKLSLIDHKISTYLLNIQSDRNKKFPITFIDIDEEDSSCITFIQANKAAELLNVEDEKMFENYSFMDDCYYYDETYDVYNKSRSKMKIGRLVNTLFPGKFENSAKGAQNKNDIESFINKYKSVTDKELKFSLIDIVSGDKIGYWYNYNRYANNNCGSLANSCMKAVNKNFYNIYVKNPETVSLVIMYSDTTKTKITARALLWKLEQPVGRFFMDRVYTNDYADEQLFIDFAKNNNWLYKSSQSMGYDVNISDPSSKDFTNDDYRGEKVDLFVKINPFRFRKFPYFDTLGLMNKHKLLIANNYKHTPDRYMTYTNGGYEELETVFSKFYNDSINKRDAVYCQIDRDWVYKSDAVYVYNSGQKHAYKNSPKIVYMTFRTKDKEINKAFLKKDCVWSDYLKTWVYYENAVDVYLNVEKTLVGIDHKKRINFAFFEKDGKYYSMDLKKKI